jgi:hypothetical protein
MKQGFLSRIIYSNFLWGGGLVLLVVSCLINYLNPWGKSETAVSESYGILSSGYLFGYSVLEVISQPVFRTIVSFLSILGTAAFLQYLSSEIRLIRVRSYYPFFLFCLVASAVLPLLPPDASLFSNLLLIFSFQRLLSAAEKEQCSRASFDATFILTLASLFQIQLLYLLPVYWLILIVLQAMNFRSFWSSVLGSLVVVWLTAGISFLLGNYSLLNAYGLEIIGFKMQDVLNLPKSELVFLSFIILLMFSALFSFWSKQHMEKLRIRNSLNAVILLWFGLLLLWFFSADSKGTLIYLFTFSSLFASHLFSLTDTFYTRLMFILTIGVSICLFLQL